MSRNKLIEETLKNAKKARDLAQAKDPAKIKEAKLLAILKNYAEDASNKVSAIPNSQAIMNKIDAAEGSIPALKDVLNEAKNKEVDAVKQTKDDADKALEAAQERVNTAVTKEQGQLSSANKVLDLTKDLTTVDEIIKELEQKKFKKSADAIKKVLNTNSALTISEAIKILEDRKSTAKTKFDNAKTAAETRENIANLTQAVDDATEPFNQLKNNTYVYKSSEYTTAEGPLTRAQAEFKKLCIDNFTIVKVSFFTQLHDDAVSNGIDAVKNELNKICFNSFPSCSGEVKFNFDGVDYSCCVVD